MKSRTKSEENLQEEKILNDLNEVEKLPQQSTTQMLHKNLMMIKTAADILEFSVAKIEAQRKQEAKKEAQRKQDEFNTYFTLSLKLAFVNKVYQVGCYHTEELANTIYHIVFKILDKEPKIKTGGWFDLRVDGYKGTIVECPAGLRLEVTGCAITMVQTQLTDQVLKRIEEWIPSILEHAALLRKLQEDKEKVPTIEKEIVIRKKF